MPEEEHTAESDAPVIREAVAAMRGEWANREPEWPATRAFVLAVADWLDGASDAATVARVYLGRVTPSGEQQ